MFAVCCLASLTSTKCVDSHDASVLSRGPRDSALQQTRGRVPRDAEIEIPSADNQGLYKTRPSHLAVGYLGMQKLRFPQLTAKSCKGARSLHFTVWYRGRRN